MRFKGFWRIWKVCEIQRVLEGLEGLKVCEIQRILEGLEGLKVCEIQMVLEGLRV